MLLVRPGGTPFRSPGPSFARPTSLLADPVPASPRTRRIYWGCAISAGGPPGHAEDAVACIPTYVPISAPTVLSGLA